MNKDAQRVAIAEAVDPKTYPSGTGTIISGEPIWINAGGWPITCPDYLNDLNACHAALASQSKSFNYTFAAKLDLTAMQKKVHPHQLTAQDWADCFIWVLNSQRDETI